MAGWIKSLTRYPAVGKGGLGEFLIRNNEQGTLPNSDQIVCFSPNTCQVFLHIRALSVLKHGSMTPSFLSCTFQN